MERISVNYWIVNEINGKEIPEPVQPSPTSEFEVKDLNDAKEKVDEICENHGIMSDWYKRDPMSKWEDAPFDDSETMFARRIFRLNTQYQYPKGIVEIRAEFPKS